MVEAWTGERVSAWESGQLLGKVYIGTKEFIPGLPERKIGKGVRKYRRQELQPV